MRVQEWVQETEKQRGPRMSLVRARNVQDQLICPEEFHPTPPGVTFRAPRRARNVTLGGVGSLPCVRISVEGSGKASGE